MTAREVEAIEAAWNVLSAARNELIAAGLRYGTAKRGTGEHALTAAARRFGKAKAEHQGALDDYRAATGART